jgi:hypothetical protein
MALAVLIALSGAPAKAVSSLTFVLDRQASYVTVSPLSGFCLGCSLSADLAFADGETFALSQGETQVLDFIDWDVAGFIGGAQFDVAARLAFSEPVGATATSGGSGGFLTFLGVVTAGGLTWTDTPSTMNLSDGSQITIDFEGGLALFDSGGVTTSASVTADIIGAQPVSAVVSLPATGGLLAAGLCALLLLRWRQVVHPAKG